LLWLKAFHVVGVVSWFAALLYLPRLFVYHAQVQPPRAAAPIDDVLGNARFKVMERKLFMIMTVAASSRSDSAARCSRSRQTIY
jgi:putative membrane protein